MSDNPLDKVDRTQELVRRAGLDEKARALLRPGLTPRQYLDQLIAAELPLAAVRFLAWALGRREAVWWASQCARAVVREKDPPEEVAALEAAQKWAAAPTEENRRDAHASAAAVDYATPAGCAALAAFWSGGSLAPPKRAAVPPAEHLLPGAVANGIILAAVKTEPEMATARYREFLALGVAVAEGNNRWKEERQAAPPRPAAPRVVAVRPAPRSVLPRPAARKW